MRSPARNVMYELWVGWNWLFAELSPVVNCVPIFPRDFELTNLLVDDSKVIREIG